MNKNVLFVIGGLDFGGQERALCTLANSLESRGLGVTIICLFQTPIAFSLNRSIEVVQPAFLRDQLSKYMYALKALAYLRRQVQARSPDVVVSFGDWYNSFTITACLGLGKSVHIASRMGPELKLGRFLELANRFFYRFAESMFVQTDRAKEILSSKYKCKRFCVVPNLVNMAPAIRMAPGEKVVISVGRLSREKGHAILVRAWSRVVAPGWRLRIIGAGPEAGSLKELTEELGLAGSVEFPSALSNIWRDLSNAEIFCLPSFYEGFPNALVEAMSVPLCCVASNCVAGPAELITHGHNGYLFDPGDYNQLANLLGDLVEQHETRQHLAQNALEVRTRLTYDNVLDSWITFLFSDAET